MDNLYFIHEWDKSCFRFSLTMNFLFFCFVLGLGIYCITNEQNFDIFVIISWLIFLSFILWIVYEKFNYYKLIKKQKYYKMIVNEEENYIEMVDNENNHTKIAINSIKYNTIQ